ncbi:MAG: RidA family protein [Deltaproteobacteria bacterium]|nr:RidA family protein [Deltaproteobacteria bacterium]
MPNQRIHTDTAPKAIGPYSQAIKSGNLVFCSGQLGLDPKTGSLASGSVTDQAHQALKNLLAVLEAAGCKSENVAKTTVFLKNMSDFAKVNEVYGLYFKAPYPARATVEVAQLPLGALFEVEAIACM